MRCEEAGPLISAGLDGELEGDGAAQLRAHLAGCARCSAEREALAAAVRLLRAIPEVDPPVELRRRIGGALLEIERRAQHRPLGLGWLARSRSSGWAWGAATGAAAAGALLILTRGHSPAPRPAHGPSAPSSHLVSLPPPAPAPLVVHPAQRHQASKKTAARPRLALPMLTAQLAPATVPSAVAPPALPPPVAAAPQTHKMHTRLIHRLLTPLRRSGPVVSPRLPKTRAVPPAIVTANSSSPSGVDSSSPDRTRPLAAPDSAARPASGSDAPSDADGMTLMAQSGPMPSPSAADEDDDLSELRRRLIDRPLQIPELGEQKSTESHRVNRDGWIRF